MYMEKNIIFDKELTILMPCLNEEETIGICIKKAKDYLKKNNIWFVENVYYEDVPFAFQTLLADGKIVT